MTERGRTALRQSPDTLAIGPSALVWDGTSLTFHLDERSLPWPSPLRGTVRVVPSALTNRTFELDADGLHRWSPLAPIARVEVALDKPALHWQGHGYLDSNYGDVPLETSFRSWHWSRATTRDAATILYDVVTSDGIERPLALRVARDGAINTIVPPPLAPLPNSRWRVPRLTRADAGTSARVLATLEDAPFYARSHVTTHLHGAAVTTIHESLSLDRFDQRWVQCLLPFRMPRRAAYPRVD